MSSQSHHCHYRRTHLTAVGHIAFVASCCRDNNTCKVTLSEFVPSNLRLSKTLSKVQDGFCIYFFCNSCDIFHKPYHSLHSYNRDGDTFAGGVVVSLVVVSRVVVTDIIASRVVITNVLISGVVASLVFISSVLVSRVLVALI